MNSVIIKLIRKIFLTVGIIMAGSVAIAVILESVGPSQDVEPLSRRPSKASVVDSRLAKLDRRIQPLLVDTEDLQASIEDAAIQLQTALAARETAIASIKEKITSIKVKIGTTVKEPPDDFKKRLLWQIDDAQQKRTHRLAQLDGLKSKLESLKGRKGFAREVVLEQMQAHRFFLQNNKIMPMESPYFEPELLIAVNTEGDLTPMVRYQRAGIGVSVDQSLQPDGLLNQLLTDIEPSENFLYFHICSDSIDAFRKTVAALKEHGVAYAWDTAVDEPMLFGLSGESNSRKVLGYR
jgi:hypothetical protein